MTDQEIDKWVEEHVKCPSSKEYDELSSGILEWSKLVAKKFYKLGKNEKKTIKGLTYRDLKKIHKIVEAMLKEKKEVYIEGQKIYGTIYPAFRASEKAFYTEVLRRLKEEVKWTRFTDPAARGRLTTSRDNGSGC